MPRNNPTDANLRRLALDPLRNFKHQTLTIEQWDNAHVIVRALSAGDWLDYRKRTTELITQARIDAGLPPLAGDAEDDPQLPAGFSATALYAFVLIRTLFDATHNRVFEDQDLDDVTAAFSPVHDRLVSKAFELSGVEAGGDSQPADPVDLAGNA
ncbi:phage tail assembly chaperone [Pseudomonas sp. 21LCFQ010]|uniref:phage tail assembly chaperone n=1 Tax=Pseudomonas sp. 21LCFQ010 TaxID=2957506 RepID=UPI002096860A|nr:phage tail assembly chaperone [Pseudomonas sp. 21LCFQ010]MCO8164844.1 phage tail assembly chaperone [Pseudomonas sp. 21LCFQ010]